MNFIEAVKSGFKNYATFSGRATRSEYWYYVLFVFIVQVVLSLLDWNTLYWLFTLAVFIPSLAVCFRRLHDTGKSGVYTLFALIPLVGEILLIIWNCADSDVGDNEYGPATKYSGYGGRPSPSPSSFSSGPATSEVRFCSNCGTPVKGDYEFCPSCGAKIVRDNTGHTWNSGIGSEPVRPVLDHSDVRKDKCPVCGTMVEWPRVNCPRCGAEMPDKQNRLKDSGTAYIATPSSGHGLVIFIAAVLLLSFGFVYYFAFSDTHAMNEEIKYYYDANYAIVLRKTDLKEKGRDAVGNLSNKFLGFDLSGLVDEFYDSDAMDSYKKIYNVTALVDGHERKVTCIKDSSGHWSVDDSSSEWDSIFE